MASTTASILSSTPGRPGEIKHTDALPLYVPSHGMGSNAAPTASQMVAIQGEDSTRKPAIAMNEELLEVMQAYLDATTTAVLAKRTARAKNEVLFRFTAWAKIEHQELTARLDAVKRGYDERQNRKDPSVPLRQRLNWIEERLGKVYAEQASLEQQVFDADTPALKANLRVAERMLDLFEGCGLIASREDEYNNTKPDDKFMEEWEIPKEPGEQRHPNNEFDKKSRGRSPRREDSGHVSHHRHSSPRRERSQSRRSGHQRHSRSVSPERQPRGGYRQRDDPLNRGHPHHRSPYSHGGSWQEDQLSPDDLALRDFQARFQDLQQAAVDFHAHWGHIDRRSEPSSQAGRRLFKANNRLTRQLIVAEDRFREVRRHCNDLRVDVIYETQSSSFAEDPESEERARDFIAKFIGPEAYPDAERWVEKVEEARDTLSELMDDRAGHLAKHEVDHSWDSWDSQSIAYGESADEYAEERTRVRIRMIQQSGDCLRKEAEEQKARVMAHGNYEQDLKLDHEDVRGAKKRKSGRARKQ